MRLILVDVYKRQTYDLGKGIRGTVGIVGPKRMDYEKVVDNLRTLKVQLDDIFKKTDE